MLAITSERRAEAAPEVPTFKELGYDVVISTLIGLFGPAGVPKPVVDQLNGVLKRVLENEDLRTKFRPDATIAEWTTPERELELFRADHAQAGRVIKSMGLEFKGQ